MGGGGLIPCGGAMLGGGGRIPVGAPGGGPCIMPTGGRAIGAGPRMGAGPLIGGGPIPGPPIPTPRPGPASPGGGWFIIGVT